MGSCCNSAAIYKYPELHFDFVRPGIMLYGATPFADKTIHDLDLKPVMTFTAEVIALNHIKAGEHVGYGSTFTADQDMTLAIVSIGYGDGYPRAFPKQNYVAINGQQTRVIGRVAMDMIAIDATDLNLQLGTEVELWGKTTWSMMSLKQMALSAMNYCVVCLHVQSENWFKMPSIKKPNINWAF